MRRRMVTGLLAVLVSTTGLSAGEPLSLSRAVCTALSNSPAVEAADASVRAAAERAKQAKGHRLPSVDVSEVYNRTDSPAESFALLLNQERFDMMNFFASDPNDPGTLTTWISRLQVVQPIYTGGKLSTRIRQAGLMSEAEKLTGSHTREQVAFDTITAYTNLAKAREYLGLLEKARATTAEHVQLAENFAGEGFIVEAEVLKAKVYLARMDEMVENARSGAELASAALNFHMGLDQSTVHLLEPVPSPPPVDSDLESWLGRALERRRDLESARRKLKVGKMEVKAASSGFRPEVALVGRLDWYDDSAFGAHGDSSSIMGVAKMNLFRGGADRAARNAAVHQAGAYASNVERFEEGVRLEVRQAWQALTTARARHATARAALVAAEESLRVREERFRQGLDKMIDLLDAETQLREAKVRELVSRYDTALAAYQLYYASGQSLLEVENLSEECR